MVRRGDVERWREWLAKRADDSAMAPDRPHMRRPPRPGSTARLAAAALPILALVGLVTRFGVAHVRPSLGVLPAFVECQAMAQAKTRLALLGHTGACGRFASPPLDAEDPYADPTGVNCWYLMEIRSSGPRLDRLPEAAANVLSSPPLPPWHAAFGETRVETSDDPLVLRACNAFAGRVVSASGP